MSLENHTINEITEQFKDKPKKRGRKPGKSRKGYFYEEEEDAFVKYITSTNQRERNELFNKKLLPAFTKMIESIIRRYELFIPSENFDDTFNDTMSDLITKLNKFNPEKGYKAYSYCGTICKNYLLGRRSKDMKAKERDCSYNDSYSDVKVETIDENKLFGWDLNTILINKMKEKIKEILSENSVLTLTNHEKSVGYALLEILTRWEDFFKETGSNKFNRSSVIYFIKEYTLLSTPEIREASRIYKKMYFDIKKNLLKE